MTASLAPSPTPPETGRIVLAGFDGDAAEDLVRALPEARLADAAKVVELVAELTAAGGVAVLCLGPALAGRAARDLLRDVLKEPSYDGLNVVLAAGDDLDVFAELVAEDRVYYLTASPPPADAVVAIVRSALAYHRTRCVGTDAGADPADADLHEVLRRTESVGRQGSVEQAMEAAAGAAAELVTADRAFVLAYDPSTETLWRTENDQEHRESAAAGLVSYVARTADAVVVERLADDPRYDKEADNESGPPDERFAAVPVIDDERVRAVVVTLRGGDEPAFDTAEIQRLRLFGEHLGPVLGRMLRRHELEARTRAEHGVFGRTAGRLFREEALEHYLQDYGEQGRPLRVVPGWTGGTYLVLLATLVAGVLFSLFGRVNEYAAGAAVVRREGRTNVTARISGTVVDVEVQPGEQVEAGQVLARLYGAQEASELERIRREFENALAQRLRDPADVSTERGLGVLRAQQAQAEARLDERLIRAPHAGTVGDVWIQPGQHLTPGQPVLNVDTPSSRLSLVALIDGQYRPLIAPGQEIRFEVDGYSYAYQYLRVATVGEDVVGPAEARRFLGPGISDAVPLSGAVVLVTAPLPDTFTSDGREYAFHEGILGRAEVRVRREPVILALVPGLRALWGRTEAGAGHG